MDEKSPPRHEHTNLKFPGNFLWGAATSAHQVEGNNVYNDWWEWEKKLPLEKRSGLAANQYQIFEQDFDLIKQLGHNAHRLSVEWSRIEPEEGKFNQLALDHYKTVLKALKDRGLTVMLTLHHFTNPLWFAKKGGWENSKSSYYFERFVKKIVPEIKDYVDLWITINEPGVNVYMGYIYNSWPPQRNSKLAAVKAFWNLARAHKKAYKAIHQIIPDSQVGVTNSFISFNTFHNHSIREQIVEWFLDIFNNHLFYKLTGIKLHDFLGVNYYFNQYISFNGKGTRIPKIVDVSKTQKDVSDLGWEIYPEGIFYVLMDLSDYHKPIYITENGIASTNDDRRTRFLLSYLKEIYHAIQTGVDIRGYFHWSLIDNFEWADGFTPRFGLVEVDYKTQERHPRPSARVYAEIIRHNGIPHHLLKLLGHSVDVKNILGATDLHCKICNIQLSSLQT